MPFYYKQRSRERLVAEAMNLKGMTFDVSIANNSVAVGNQIVNHELIGVYAGDVITSIYVAMGGVGTSVTLFKAGITTTAATRVAITADFSGSLAVGMLKMDLITPYAVTADGAVYLSCLAVAATGPTLQCGTSVSAAGGVVANSGFRKRARQTGQADIPASAVFADVGSVPWMGWS